MTHRSSLSDFQRDHGAEPTLSIVATTMPRTPRERTEWYATICQEFGRIRRVLAETAPDQLAAFEVTVERFIDRIPHESRGVVESGFAWFGNALGATELVPLPMRGSLKVSWGAPAEAEADAGPGQRPGARTPQ